MIFEKLANGITKHAKLIVVIWILVLIASAYPAMHSTEKLSTSTDSMGGDDTESIQGAMILGTNFTSSGSSTDGMQIILMTYSATNPDIDSVYGILKTNIEAMDHILMAEGKGANGVYNIMVVYNMEEITANDMIKDTGHLRDVVSASIKEAADHGYQTSDIKTYVTGSAAISYDASSTMSHDMAIVDPISIFLIIVLIGLFFRSFVSSAAPPITIGVAFALVMCALFFLGQVLDIFYIVEMLLLVSMLGAGCDYCIFILSRYREERRRGLEHIEACRQAIIWAGESVTTSGLAVMIGFGSMMVCDFKFISTLGLGLAIGIVFALFAALTLMSSLIVILGDRLFWPSGASGPKLEKGYLKKFGNLAHRYFTISTRFSIKHAKAIVVATILFTVPMLYVYATSESSYDMIGAMMSGESKEGMDVMNDNGYAGSIMPNYAVVEIPSLGTVESKTITMGTQNMNVNTIQWSPTSGNTLNALDNMSVYIENLDDKNISEVSHITTWDKIENVVNTVGPALPAPYTASDYATANFGQVVAAVSAGKETFHISSTTLSVLASVWDAYKNVTVPIYGSMDLMPMLEIEGMYLLQGVDYNSMMDYNLLVSTRVLGFDKPVDPEAATPAGDITYATVTMSTVKPAMDNESIRTVDLFTNEVHKYVDGDATLKAVWATGTASVMVEISNMMTQQFLKIEITAIVLIIILLFFVMKSYLTPIRSVVTILMSVVWTLAITNLLFTDVLHQGVLWMLPIMLLVICLGLGMDYDILLTTRIREYRFAKGMSNEESITQAVLHSGSVITLCGLIMAGTFGTMMLSSTVMLQQMGFAMAFAILIDALVIRTYIVPAAMYLMNDWNWKGPAFLQRKKAAPVAESEKNQE